LPDIESTGNSSTQALFRSVYVRRTSKPQ